MTLDILKLTLGPIQTNCFMIGDSDSHDCIVIDPSDRAELIFETAQERGWTIREILATHGHFDHILASAALKRLTGAPFRCHLLDLPLIEAMPRMTQQWIGIVVPPAAKPDAYVAEGDRITVGAIALDVLFTPGHAPGHVSYLLRSEKTVFSGDCLFFRGIGRTDLPGCDYDTLMQSIASKLLTLDDDTVVAPGHMQNTTIGYERQNNPYVLDYLGVR
jgi:hydroxyacylglutathione hydrolase